MTETHLGQVPGILVVAGAYAWIPPVIKQQSKCPSRVVEYSDTDTCPALGVPTVRIAVEHTTFHWKVRQLYSTAVRGTGRVVFPGHLSPVRQQETNQSFVISLRGDRQQRLAAVVTTFRIHTVENNRHIYRSG